MLNLNETLVQKRVRERERDKVMENNVEDKDENSEHSVPCH